MHSATAFHSVSVKQVAAWKPSSSPSGRRVEDQNERLRHFIRQLQRMQFGRRSEKLDPDQLALALEISNRRLPKAKPNRRRRISRCATRAAGSGGRRRLAGSPAADRGGD
jgi:transposase IS166 family protein